MKIQPIGMGGSKMRLAVNHMWIVLFIFSFYTVQYIYLFQNTQWKHKVKMFYSFAYFVLRCSMLRFLSHCSVLWGSIRALYSSVSHLISFLVLAQSSPCVSVCIVRVHLPQTLNYTTLTNSRWLKSDTVGGFPHNAENQSKIHIVATHIHTCKTKHAGIQNSYVLCSHTDICNEMNFSKDLLGSCVCPVCQLLLLTSTSSDNLSLHFGLLTHLPDL